MRNACMHERVRAHATRAAWRCGAVCAGEVEGSHALARKVNALVHSLPAMDSEAFTQDYLTVSALPCPALTATTAAATRAARTYMHTRTWMRTQTNVFTCTHTHACAAAACAPPSVHDDRAAAAHAFSPLFPAHACS